MDSAFIVLNLAVLAAAALQSATGIGFGIIAGPIMLIVLNDGSAIHISIMLNLVIAVLLTPALMKDIDRTLLGRLVAGLLVGTPIGVWAFLAMDIILLKLAAALVVVMTMILMLRSRNASEGTGPVAATDIERGSMGVIAGMMGGSLGMPGPVPAAWMSSKGYGKTVIRATILAMFIVSYALSFGLQLGAVGISGDTFSLAARLAPATVLGIMAGRFLHHRITERAFRKLLFVILLATVVLLLVTLV
jgi:uncharacterized membrane protein YfcA